MSKPLSTTTKASTPLWRGVLPAITTQMHRDGSINLDVNVRFVQNIKLCVQECGLGKEWRRTPCLRLAGAERKALLKGIREGIAAAPKIPKRK
ncbi:hypothetical protein BH11VER1_BH11VER1_18290 [soil metagenome]